VDQGKRKNAYQQRGGRALDGVMNGSLAATKEAHMTYRCSACEVSWWPKQADRERCPMCGGAVTHTEGPASDDAEMLYRIVRGGADGRGVCATDDGRR
jgi:hypothetical protein